MEVLPAALILVAAISVGVSSMYIARGRSSINKHSRQRIKDYESDIKYLGEVKKADAAEYRQEILRLKGTINKMKQGTTVTETDMKNASGLGDIIMQLIPNKYRKAASFLVPQVEEAVKKDPAIIERVYEKIKSANTSNKQTQPGAQDETTNTL